MLAGNAWPTTLSINLNQTRLYFLCISRDRGRQRATFLNSMIAKWTDKAEVEQIRHAKDRQRRMIMAADVFKRHGT